MTVVEETPKSDPVPLHKIADYMFSTGSYSAREIITAIIEFGLDLDDVIDTIADLPPESKPIEMLRDWYCLDDIIIALAKRGYSATAVFKTFTED